MNALREHRVVGVGVGVELAELVDELADVVSGGGVIAVLLLELLQALEGVAVLGLVVGDLEVAEAGLGIDDTGAAIVGAAVIGSAIVAATAATLLSLTRLALPALTLTLSLTLTLLTWLLALPTLAAAGGLLLQHLAEAFEIGQALLGGPILLGVFGIVGAGAQSLLDLFQLVADLVEALGEIGFRHDGVFAETAPEVIGVALHVALHLRLLDAAQGFTHFSGGGAFGSLEVAGGGLHAGAKLLEVVDFSVLLGSQLGGFLAGEVLALRSEGATHLAFKILLFIGERVGLAGEIFDLILGLAGANAGERLGGLIETISRAAGVGLGLGRAGLLG